MRTNYYADSNCSRLILEDDASSRLLEGYPVFAMDPEIRIVWPQEIGFDCEHTWDRGTTWYPADDWPQDDDIPPPATHWRRVGWDEMIEFPHLSKFP